MQNYIRPGHRSTKHQVLSLKLALLSIYFRIVLNIFLDVDSLNTFALNNKH